MRKKRTVNVLFVGFMVGFWLSFGVFFLPRASAQQVFYPDLLVDPVPAVFLYYNEIHFTIRNIGQRAITESFDVQFQWTNEAGEPVGSPRVYTHRETIEVAEAHSFLANGDVGYIGGQYQFSSDNHPEIAAYVNITARPEGATRVLVTLDPANEIVEINENNNTGSAPQAPAVDVELNGVRYDVVNGYRAMLVRIKNNGEDPGGIRNPRMPRSSFVFRWLDERGQTILWYSARAQRSVLGGIESMAVPNSGEEREIPVYVTEWSADGVLVHPPENAVSLKIQADDAQAYREPNENDNTIIIPLNQLVLTPDLFIDPVNQVRLQPDQLFFTIRNIGQRPVTEPFDVTFQWTDAAGNTVGPSRTYTHTGGLGVAQVFRRFTNGGVAFLDGDYRFDSNEHPDIDDYILHTNKPEGAARLTVTLDPAHALEELNEENNSASTVQDPLVDLTVQNVRADVVNGRYALVVTIANIGGNRDEYPVNTRAPRISFILRWLDAAGRNLSWNSASLGRTVDGGIQQFTPPLGGETVEVPVYANPNYGDGFFQRPPDGAVSIKIEVDDAWRFNEEREDNNVLVVPLDSIPLVPDLFIDGTRQVTLYPDRLLFTLHNIGQRRVTESVPMYFQWIDAAGAPVGPHFAHIDERDLELSTVYGRYANGDPAYGGRVYHFSSDNFPALDDYIHYTNKPAGAAKLRIMVDPSNALPELLETNNKVEVRQGPVVDVAVESARTEWTERGYALIFSVKNVGIEADTLTGGPRSSVSLKWLDATGRALQWRSARDGRLTDYALADLPFLVPGVMREVTVYAAEGSSEGFFLHRPEGAEAIRFEADDAGRFSEPNEENNIFIFYLEQPQEPEALIEAQEDAAEEALASTLAEDAPSDEVTEEVQQTTEAEAPTSPATEEATPIEPAAEEGEVVPEEHPADAPAVDPALTPQITAPATVADGTISAAEQEADAAALEELVRAEKTPVQTKETAKPEEAPRPKILPGDTLYFLKAVGRSLKLLITFNKEKETTLRLRYTSERALEMSELADQGKQTDAVKAAKKYEKELEKAVTSLEELKKENVSAAAGIETQILKQGLLHQVLLGKVERLAPSSEAAAVKAARETSIVHLGEVVSLAAQTDAKKAEELISTAAKQTGTSPLSVLKNIEVLRAVVSHVDNDTAQEAIEKVIERRIERVEKEIESSGIEPPTAPEPQKTEPTAEELKTAPETKPVPEILPKLELPKLEVPQQEIKLPQITIPKLELPQEPAPKPQPISKPEEPAPCSDEKLVVCGEDGQTYDSECLAKNAGTIVAYEGKCITISFSNSVEMLILPFGISPFVADVVAGGTVVFINEDLISHTIIIQSGQTIVVPAQGKAELKAPVSKGIFNLYSKENSKLTGIIVTH